MKNATEDIYHRRPVWEALSDLFLDTDTSLSREWRVKILAASPYSVEELQEILLNEVTPICRWSLACIAGEWAGFDQEWLEKKILRRVQSPSRFFRFLKFRRVSVMISDEWNQTITAILKTRLNQSDIKGMPNSGGDANAAKSAAQVTPRHIGERRKMKKAKKALTETELQREYPLADLAER